jgi:hypothetical protein
VNPIATILTCTSSNVPKISTSEPKHNAIDISRAPNGKAGKGLRSKQTIGNGARNGKKTRVWRKYGKAGKRKFGKAGKSKKSKQSLKISKKGAKKGRRRKYDKKPGKSPAPSAIQVDVPTRSPVVTSAPSMPAVVPTASPVRTAQPTTRPTPPGGSPTMVPTITPAVTLVPTSVVFTDAPTPIITTDSPTPSTTGNTNMPTPATDTGNPTESPTISLMLGSPTSLPTAVPDDATSAPTPLVESEVTDAPTSAPVEASGAPTPAVVTSAPTPLVVSNVPTPAINTGTPTESPTISLMLGGPTSPPTAMTISSEAPTPAIDTGRPTLSLTAVPVETPVPTPISGDFPTAAPIPIPPTGLPVNASPFSLTYETSGVDPTEAQFSDAERITREYLEQFFIDFFEFSFEGDFVSLSVDNLGNTIGPPPRIDYDLAAFFFPLEERIPTTEEVDIIIQTAFLQPSVQTLLLELRTLPVENPFSSTSTVFYSMEPMAAPLLTPSSDSSATTVPVVLIGMAAGVGALACIITAIFAARRRSHYRPIKPHLPTKDGMPCRSNIMAFMDRELTTSRSGSSRSSCSFHRIEV